MHPGVVIIPAALAIGETEGASGKDLIVALAAGYEVAARLSRGFGHISIPRGFRSTPVYGPFGAAAAAGKLLRLSEDKIVLSLGWAANLSSGVLQCALVKSPEMPIQAGIAARNGILAARLGQVGAEVAEVMLEGERGFYFAFCGSAQGTEKILPDLGQEYWMLDVIQKRFPIGGALQSSMFSVLQLLQENDVRVENIEKIDLRLNPAFAKYPGINSLHPGLISAQYGIAVACVHRKLTLRTVADMDNPRVRELMARITLEPDEKVNPPGCKLSVTLKDKRVLRKDMLIGYKDFCFSFADEQKHVESLFPQMAVSREGLTKMIELVRDMEKVTSVAELTRALASPGRKGERIKLPF
jgi:2-methylcitrate dehydratase PrpD